MPTPTPTPPGDTPKYEFAADLEPDDLPGQLDDRAAERVGKSYSLIDAALMSDAAYTIRLLADLLDGVLADDPQAIRDAAAWLTINRPGRRWRRHRRRGGRVSRDVAAWWCNRVLEVRPDVVWMTTDEYLDLRDAVTRGIREYPVVDNGAAPCLMGRPVVLVDQFDTYKFTIEDERRRYLGPVFPQ